MSGRFVVVGAGTMGLGIAYVAAGAGYAVELVEVDPARGAEALRRLGELWDRGVQRGKLTEEAATANRERVTLRAGLAEVAEGADVIVEAVPERLDLKRAVLREAESRRPALLGSNTSSIPIAELAAGLDRPADFVGLHFFNPVWAMALLEVVVGPATAPETTEAAVALAARLGKDPVVVRDMPGFATSRLGVTLGLEAIRMVADEVASPADIDKAMVLGYRHPIGPLELTDLVGLDVRLDIARTLQAAYGDRFAPPPLLVEMVAAGKLGKKSGQGFYTWKDGVKQ
ncbi:3-hydroxyacyl-CoA dehydrogenase family protein [Micromonospora aurantiaca]|uniref:3-hydroxyacyl-CoA dehydrogenase family protein n=1 Tax=Micromonospora aurantiaca (nom. illeg.) TaxID=47850 RepID=A0ABQ6UL73_9ACTN|nr:MULTISPECIES: 3-hydroxyacyl-CoA dehydrogenase family protein [Micromonospora]ADU05765.1 3-hydroxyacyl-CoA dehydrogenase NAD-binding protein [Micromonospora sp. L5]KAB1117132.1 3-hydroxyacyl-CoA dehydrogenase family protein [Micromonospora aurantiaca]OHX04821.1 3-hydroxybutyryl-CoA dehydrogenase [Micromonospora sp. WMMB235]RNI02565.1 3-hydroxyacyl-CoA dehydrogenase family protein [Micromonospora aurantiaca]UFN94800.1 3-hydroxyacyl-CoA dehydrogenase family protein [Micromonospora aurantiaca]